MRKCLPGMQGLGIEPTDAWFTAYGDAPQIMVGGSTPEMGSMQQVLTSAGWVDLREKLMQYVDNFAFKLVRARAGFQL